MWGAVGVSSVIPDNEWPCSCCCPFRRSYPAHSSSNMCTALAKEATLAMWDEEARFGVSGYDARYRNDTADIAKGAAAAPCASRDQPCVYNVVTDVAESTNLFGNPTYNATIVHLMERVDYHLGRYANFSIDHSNQSAAAYCDAVNALQWVQPFEDFVPSPPPPPPSPPPQPVPSTPQAELAGDWVATNGERYSIAIDPAHSGNAVYGLFVKTGPNLTLCWSPMLPGTASRRDSNGGMDLTVGGPATKCSGGKRSMQGTLVWDPRPDQNPAPSKAASNGSGGAVPPSSPASSAVGSPRTAPRITWTDAATGKPGWKPWSKVI